VELEQALTQHFGFPGFRPGQREACKAALAGRDVLVVMPTGAGKSLCYQLPALMGEDLTVVVSPLVSLMQDQVEALGRRGLGHRAALVNAQQDAARNAQALERASRGELSLLYVAPERFSSPGFVERLRDVSVGLFVVDEAHCVSEWGHDFRPDYFRLADAARYLGAGSIVASTATATPRVAVDVAKRLGLRDPVRVSTGFDRPNLSFAVLPVAGLAKARLLARELSRPDALPAIVYAGTRAGAEEWAGRLCEDLGETALAYHAGLDRERRATAQRRFLDGEVRVVVATNAFGMGIDKADVRTVVHASVPSSLEAYYQEAGRAGRDGQPARALLLAEGRDKALHVHFIRRDEADPQLAGRVAARLAAAAGHGGRYAVEAAPLAREVGCGLEQLRAVIGHLARAGVLSPSPSSPDQAAGRVVAAFDRRAAGLCRGFAAEASRSRWRQYREVWGYVDDHGCRRERILRHFGDPRPRRASGPCCDECDPSLAPALEPISAAEVGDLDAAIASVVRAARPAVGRTLCAEILHGARTKKIERNAYDGLPAYGAWARMRRADIVGRIDQLLDDGRLGTTSGPYPVLTAAPPALAA
jgi:ATP-dependent DNA helicase RecQ